MSNIVKGKKLMIWVKGATGSYTSIGYCTNHTLSTSASTINVSHKDLADAGASGKWDDADIDTLSWTITSENFYAETADGKTFAELFAYYSAGTVLDIKFGTAATSTTGVPEGGWAEPATGTVLTGKAIITSLDLNAPNDDNASVSITFTGKGPLAVAE
jgi:predicted secreted protein